MARDGLRRPHVLGVQPEHFDNELRGGSQCESRSRHVGRARRRFSYTNGSNVSVNGYYYDWYDIARAAYADAKFTLAKANAPYVAVQYFTEGSTGRAVAGRIANDTYGFQIGATPLRGLSASVGVDVVPARIAFVNATSAARATAGLWVPIGGTPSAVAAGAGRYLVSYGGIASTYTESYAADPLYTTSITAGAVDRRSSGNSIKGTLTCTARSTNGSSPS